MLARLIEVLRKLLFVVLLTVTFILLVTILFPMVCILLDILIYVITGKENYLFNKTHDLLSYIVDQI